MKSIKNPYCLLFTMESIFNRVAFDKSFIILLKLLLYATRPNMSVGGQIYIYFPFCEVHNNSSYGGGCIFHVTITMARYSFRVRRCNPMTLNSFCVLSRQMDKPFLAWLISYIFLATYNWFWKYAIMFFTFPYHAFIQNL